MKLNTEVIKNLDLKNKINNDFFYMLLTEEGVVNDLFSNESTAGFTWGEWDRTIELIEKLAVENNFLTSFSMDEDKYLVFNFLVFFPSFSNDFIRYFLKDILKLKESKLLILLTNKDITYQIVSELNRVLPLKVSNLTPKKLLFIVLAAFQHNIYSHNEEIKLIDKVILVYENTKNHDWEILLRFLKERRLSVIRSNYDSLSVGKHRTRLRCALIISGQFRYPTNNVDSLIEKVSINSHIDLNKVFVASWNKLGGYCLNETNKFYRHLTKGALNLIDEKAVNLSSLMKEMEVKKNIDSEISIENITSENSVDLNCILNEEESNVYLKMTNPEKMYYNNYLWVERLGVDYFMENFDLLIKVRPDIDILNFTSSLNNLDIDSVLAEEGYVFKRWGFGVGDQVLVGSPKAMLPLLSCYSDEDVISLVELLYGKKDKYRGHINIGLRAWLNNINVKRIPNFKHMLIKPPMIDENEIDTYLSNTRGL